MREREREAAEKRGESERVASKLFTIFGVVCLLINGIYDQCVLGPEFQSERREVDKILIFL